MGYPTAERKRQVVAFLNSHPELSEGITDPYDTRMDSLIETLREKGFYSKTTHHDDIRRTAFKYMVLAGKIRSGALEEIALRDVQL